MKGKEQSRGTVRIYMPQSYCTSFQFAQFVVLPRDGKKYIRAHRQIFQVPEHFAILAVIYMGRIKRDISDNAMPNFFSAYIIC